MRELSLSELGIIHGGLSSSKKKSVASAVIKASFGAALSVGLYYAGLHNANKCKKEIIKMCGFVAATYLTCSYSSDLVDFYDGLIWFS